MADFLALEWEHEQICGVLAQVSGGKVRIQRCFTLGKPVGSATGSGAIPVDWLKTALEPAGIVSGQTLVSLPRDEAVVKLLGLPETTDDELPVLVKFQAGSKSSVPLDELALDFMPLPRRSEVPGREVLMATVPRATVDEVSTLCERAGLQITSLGLTPGAVAELVARSETSTGEDASGASLVVSRHGNRIEISVLRQHHLLFSHSARLSDEGSSPEQQAIVAEVSRALVALRGLIANLKIGRVWTLVPATDHEHLAEALKKRLNCEVQPLDPFFAVEWDRGRAEIPSDRAFFAGPIGMLLAHGEPRVPAIDFLNPRKPPIKKDNRKRRLVFIGGAAAAVVLTLLGLYALELSDLNGQITDLQNANRKLDDLLKRGEKTLKSADLVQKWDADSVSWLDEWVTLTERMPATERIYLESLEFVPKMGAAGARIKSGGLARGREDVLKLSDQFLTEDNKYRMLPLDVNPSSKDDIYPWRFTSEVVLNDPPKDKKPVAGAAKPESSGKGSASAPTDKAEQAAGKTAPAGPSSESTGRAS